MNIAKIVQAINDSNINFHVLSGQCDIGYATLYDIAHGKTKNPRIDTVIKISQALNISIDELLSKEEEHEENNT